MTAGASAESTPPAAEVVFRWQPLSVGRLAFVYVCVCVCFSGAAGWGERGGGAWRAPALFPDLVLLCLDAGNYRKLLKSLFLAATMKQLPLPDRKATFGVFTGSLEPVSIVRCCN